MARGNKANLIFGYGINDYTGSVFINKKNIKSYTTWRDMLKRCYSEEYHSKHQSYIGCYVCEEWKYYTNFKKWYDNNYPHDLASTGIIFNLDKDLLVDGNKKYGPDTCVFLPQKINRFLSTKYKNNSSGMVGVVFHKATNKFLAQANSFVTGKQIHLGLFTNKETAKESYDYFRSINVLHAKEYLRDLGYNEDIVNKLGGR